MERGRDISGTVTLARATPEQRSAVQRLLGRRPAPGRSLNVPLEAVDAVLRRSGVSPEGLGAAVEALVGPVPVRSDTAAAEAADRKSTRLNSSHVAISYAVFCLKKKI